MNPSKDYINSDERLDFDTNFSIPGEDWRQSQCPRLAWFFLGGFVGSCLTWAFISAYHIGG